MKTTIGQQLRQAREARRLSLEQVAQATLMRVRYLQALEAGEFDSLPSKAQARGFLRAYASFVNLDPAPLLKSLDQEAFPPDGAITLGADVPASAPSTSRVYSLPDKVDETSAAIFVEIGQRLQHRRELLGLSLEDVERHTHLRQHYLRALEAGNLTGLPSPVQGRGMLNNYAAFLGLNSEPLLLRFAEGLQAGLEARRATHLEDRPTKPSRSLAPASPPGALRRLLSGDLIVGGTLALFLAGFFIWGAIRIFTLGNGQGPAPTALSISAVLLASPTLPPVTAVLPTATHQSRAATPTPTAAQSISVDNNPAVDNSQSGAPGQPPVAVTTDQPAPGGIGQPVAGAASKGGGAQVRVYITINQRSWMRATVDGKVEFEGRVLPGSAYNFSGTDKVEIFTSNAAGLQIFFNQNDLGRLGAFGQIVSRIFTVKGILTPTPTVTPTRLPTARPTATPQPANKPVGTPTRPALP